MRLDKQHLGIHLLWALPAFLVVFGLSFWYFASSYQARLWLGGGSLPGLVCGVMAGGIIAFEMLLWPRKWLRAWRLMATKHWLAAHLWFGLASWPLAVVHSGFHFGGLLPSVFLVLFTLTILSGIYGWILQNVIPKLMLKQITSETIYSQIEVVSQRNSNDARAMIVGSMGPPPGEIDSEDWLDSELGLSRSSVIVVGAIRDIGRVRGRTLRTSSVQLERKDSDKIWNAYSELKDYIERGGAHLPFASATYSSNYFANLRRSCDKKCAAIIDSLEEYCDQRRQFDVQKRLHVWLHSWLPVHIGLSVAVSTLLIVHVYTALRYL